MLQTPDLESTSDPCDLCLRFPECFGVDKPFCPLCVSGTAAIMEPIISNPVRHRYDDFKIGAVLNNVVCVRNSDG